MNKFKFIFISFILIVLVPFSVSGDDSSDESISCGSFDNPCLASFTETDIDPYSVSLYSSFDSSSILPRYNGTASNSFDGDGYTVTGFGSPSGTDHGGHEVSYAFDDSFSTFHGTYSASPENHGKMWARITFDSPQDLSGLFFAQENDLLTINFQFQIDNGIWVSTGSLSGTRKTITFDTPYTNVTEIYYESTNHSYDWAMLHYFDAFGTPSTLYSLNLSANPVDGGTVSGSGQYPEGSSVTISAVPNEGYHFVSWSDGDTHSTRQITLSSDLNLIANFETSSFPSPVPPDISDNVTNYPEQSDQINSSISIGSTSGGSGGAGSILYTVTDFYNVYTLPRVTWNALVDKQKLECDVSKQPYVCTYQYDDYSDPDDPRNKYLTFEYFTNPYDSNIFLYAYSYSQLSIKGPNIVVSDGASLIKVGTGLPEPFDIKYAYVFGDNVIARDIDTFDYIYTDNVAHVSDNLEQLSSFIQSLPYDTYNLSYQGQVSVSSEVIKSGSYSSIVIGSGDTTLTLYAAISDSTSTVQTINVQVNQLIEQEQNNLTNSELADVNKELDNMNNLIENGNSESQNASTKLDDSYSSFIDVSGHFDSLEQNYLDSLSSQLGDLDISFDLGNNSDFVNSANFVKTNFDKLVDNPFGIIIGFSLAIGICLLMLGKRL